MIATIKKLGVSPGARRRRRFIVALALAIILCTPVILLASSSRPPAAKTGAPGESTCSNCHGGAGTGRIEVRFPAGGGSTYTAGATQRLQVVVTDTTNPGGGFELSARTSSNTTAGTLAIVPGDVNAQVWSGGAFQYVGHTATGNSTKTWSFDWTPPATGSGTVTLYVAGIAANLDGSESGDFTYTANYPLTEALAPPTLPNLTVDTTTLSLSSTVGGASASQSRGVTSTGTPITFTASTSVTTPVGGTWLTATVSAGGTTPGSVNITATPGSLAAGTYTGAVSIASTGAANTPRTIPVSFTVAKPNLTVDTSALTLSATQGGTAASASRNVTASSGSLSFTASASTTPAGGTWLTATVSAGGTTPGSVTITANAAGLAAGTYNGSVSIASSGAANSPQTIPVSFNVAALPNLTVDTTTLAFTSMVGGSSSSQSRSVTSSGAAITYTTSAAVTSPTGGTWLTVSAGGTTPGSVSITANPAGLGAGSYAGSVSIASTGAGNSPRTIPVTLTVTALPNLTVDTTTLAFSSAVGGASSSQSRSVTSTGAALSYTTSVTIATPLGGTWLTASAGGTTPGSVNITANPAGLAAGTYNGSVGIASTGAGNGPLTIPVTLTVTAAAPLTITATPAPSFAFTLGGTPPGPQTVHVTSNGGTPGAPAPTFTAAPSPTDTLGLVLSPSSGAVPGDISVSVNPAGKAVGTYTSAFTVTATGASNSATVNVTLVVTDATTPPPVAPNLKFEFAAGASQTDAPHLMKISGSGSILGGTLSGGGSFTEYAISSSRRTRFTVLSSGKWKATRFLSFTPTVPASSGEHMGGILVLEVQLLPTGKSPIVATLQLVANDEEGGLITGQKTGVTITEADGTKYVPYGSGEVAFSTPSTEHDDRESDHVEKDSK